MTEQIADAEEPEAKKILKSAGNKALANLVDILTSKGTWMTLGGIALDAATSGGTLTIKSLGFVALRIFQQAMADHGKNAAPTITVQKP